MLVQQQCQYQHRQPLLEQARGARAAAQTPVTQQQQQQQEVSRRMMISVPASGRLRVLGACTWTESTT